MAIKNYENNNVKRDDFLAGFVDTSPINYEEEKVKNFDRIYTIKDIIEGTITAEELAGRISYLYREAHDLSILDFLIGSKITAENRGLMFDKSKDNSPKMEHDKTIPHEIKAFYWNWNKRVKEGYHAGEIHPNNGSIRIKAYTDQCEACRLKGSTSLDLQLFKKQNVEYESLSKDELEELVGKIRKERLPFVIELMIYDDILGVENGHSSHFKDYFQTLYIINERIKNFKDMKNR